MTLGQWVRVWARVPKTQPGPVPVRYLYPNLCGLPVPLHFTIDNLEEVTDSENLSDDGSNDGGNIEERCTEPESCSAKPISCDLETGVYLTFSHIILCLDHTRHDVPLE
jgi:hypothetical protein